MPRSRSSPAGGALLGDDAVVGGRRGAVDQEGVARPRVCQHQVLADRRRAHPGEGRGLLGDLAQELLAARLVEALAVEVEGEHGQMIALESGVDAQSVLEAQEEEGGAGQRHDRQADLPDDEEVAQAEGARRPPTGDRGGGVPERRHEVGAAGGEGGDQPKEERGGERERKGEGEDAAVEGEFQRRRQVRGLDARDEGERPASEQQAGGAGRQGTEQAEERASPGRTRKGGRGGDRQLSATARRRE